jgi:hypothetical protein
VIIGFRPTVPNSPPSSSGPVRLDIAPRAISNRNPKIAFARCRADLAQEVAVAMYMVLPRRRQSGFKVELIDDDGVRRTILGFKSEAEAQAWIEEDRRLNAFRGSLAAD